jgi:hypothetical protein
VTLSLKSIDDEAAACRAAWAAAPNAWYGAHIHHEKACEALIEPIEVRILYILHQKPEKERAIRLRLMRPTTPEAFKAYYAAMAEPQKAYDAAMVEAQKEYYAAMAEPQKAWDAAIAEPQKAYYAARAEAQKAWDAAMAETQKAWDATRAEAQKAYDAAMVEAHWLICSVEECPFDGKTIFPKVKS